MRTPLLLVLLLALAGCEITPHEAQEALTSGAEVIQELDEGIAPLVVSATDRCNAEHPTRAPYVQCMARLAPLEYGVALARAGAEAAQRKIDTWRLGTVGWSAVIPVIACAAHGVSVIVSAVRQLGWADEINEMGDAQLWLDLIENIASLACDEALLELDTPTTEPAPEATEEAPR